MSLRAISWAWTARVAPTAKFVLVALADHADETGLCWPSLARLREFTRLSERAIRAALRDLEAVGLIATDQRIGRMSRYMLRLGGHEEPRQEMPGYDDETPARAAGDPGAKCRGPRQEMPETPAAAAPEPSRTVNEPPVNRQVVQRTPRGARLPPTWGPTPEDACFAAQMGLDPDDAAAEFRDYWIGVPGAKGCKLDWSATFRNSCRMQAKRKRPGKAEPAQPWWLEDMLNERAR